MKVLMRGSDARGHHLLADRRYDGAQFCFLPNLGQHDQETRQALPVEADIPPCPNNVGMGPMSDIADRAHNQWFLEGFLPRC
jgi:hypothetical protein